MPVLAAALPAVLAQVPGLRLLVAGPGDADEVRAAMTPEVAAATEFLGAVDDAAKAALLRSVDVYIAPNTGGESFGIILIEAMSARGTVLASDIPPSCGCSTGNGRRSSTRTDDLARQLVRLLRDDTERPWRLPASPCRPVRLVSRGDAITLVYETVCEGAAAARAMPGHGVLGRLRRGGRSLP
jgi:phosphatidylinositol alpha-mannosyltransferase